MVFGQTLHHGFVNYDDAVYIADNPVVLGGLSLKGIAWAFTHCVNANWTPLTVISHMLDCQLYGTQAGWHHLTSVLLHMASAIVLFLVLKEMTGALWRSAFVAAVFAVHPLHVESVAWIAERRDVLSGLFFVLTLGAYTGYVRHPQSLSRYLIVVLMLALALMSKPTAVTLPFVLLLLDYWPLKRFTQPAGRLIPWRLIAEKLPVMALSGIACVATLFAQEEAIASLPLSVRIGNALVSYVAYLGQMIYPVGLAVYYPHPRDGLALWKIIAAFVLLLVVSIGAIAAQRKQPWFLFGWLWYLGMLVPVIGLVQVGGQARADRYTYLPQIGLYILLTWTLVELTASWRSRRWVCGGGAMVVLAVLIACARTQTTYWRNSETLWAHALVCTSNNTIAHNNLGDAFFRQERMGEAVSQYQQTLAINPNNAEANYDLGNAFFQQGRMDEALAQFQKTLAIQPSYTDYHYNYADIHNNLGNVFLRQGRMDEAVVQFQKALAINLEDANTHYNLGNALRRQGGVNEAIAQFEKALALKPQFAEARYNLGNAFLQQRRVDEAITQFRKALTIKPDYVEARNNLAWVLATCPQASLRNGIEAVKLAEQADQLAGGTNPVVLCTLGAAYAEAGRFPEAIETAQHAMHLVEAQSNNALSALLQSQLKLYQAGIPFHGTEQAP
ncbi:MAG: tetratricopeptide repeat protein [Verrucomicrobiota bacterium]|jgi:tetratricopeptide (TPR) repeat protein